MKKKRFKGEFIILSYDPTNFSYEDYVEFCKDNDIEPEEDNSEDFWNWVSDTANFYFEDDLCNIKNCDAYAIPVRLNGSLGLWNSNPDIEENIYDNVYDALKKILDVNFDYTINVKWVNGKITISQSHHDGTNYFEITPKDRRKKLPYLYTI